MDTPGSQSDLYVNYQAYSTDLHLKKTRSGRINLQSAAESSQLAQVLARFICDSLSETR